LVGNEHCTDIEEPEKCRSGLLPSSIQRLSGLKKKRELDVVEPRELRQSQNLKLLVAWPVECHDFNKLSQVVMVTWQIAMRSNARKIRAIQRRLDQAVTSVKRRGDAGLSTTFCPFARKQPLAPVCIQSGSLNRRYHRDIAQAPSVKAWSLRPEFFDDSLWKYERGSNIWRMLLLNLL